MPKTPLKHIVVEGLLPLAHDSRDFKHSSVFGASPVMVPDADFNVCSPEPIKNQFETDFCTAFSTSGINGAMQEQDFDPFFQFAKISQVKGEFKSYGADLRTACKALTKYGSLPVAKSPYNYTSITPPGTITKRDFMANWANWPVSLDVLAGEWKCGSYFEVDGPNDKFDNIRAILWQNKEERAGVLIGVLWRPEWTYAPGGVIPDATYTKPAGSGHAIRVIGQKKINGKQYLVVPNSWSTGLGDKGVYYFPRSVINLEVALFGAFALKDIDAETAKKYIDYNLTTQDNVIAIIVKIIIGLAKQFKTLLQ